MKVTTTARGHQSIQFTDQAGARAILEQTTGIDYGNPAYDQPDSSYILLGRKDAPIKLNMEQAAELIEHLQVWLEEGRFAKAAQAEIRSRKTA